MFKSSFVETFPKKCFFLRILQIEISKQKVQNSVHLKHIFATFLYIHMHIFMHNTRAVTVLDFVLPRWSSNKYRGYAVNRTTTPPPSTIFFDMVALVQMHGLLLLRAAEPQHIVAGVRFHWSREEKHFQASAS